MERSKLVGRTVTKPIKIKSDDEEEEKQKKPASVKVAPVQLTPSQEMEEELQTQTKLENPNDVTTEDEDDDTRTKTKAKTQARQNKSKDKKLPYYNVPPNHNFMKKLNSAAPVESKSIVDNIFSPKDLVKVWKCNLATGQNDSENASLSKAQIICKSAYDNFLSQVLGVGQNAKCVTFKGSSIWMGKQEDPKKDPPCYLYLNMSTSYRILPQTGTFTSLDNKHLLPIAHSLELLDHLKQNGHE